MILMNELSLRHLLSTYLSIQMIYSNICTPKFQIIFLTFNCFSTECCSCNSVTYVAFTYVNFYLMTIQIYNHCPMRLWERRIYAICTFNICWSLLHYTIKHGIVQLFINNLCMFIAI